MEIFNHIQALLFRYECVIVPGFGAFLTRHHSAEIDASGQFTQPGKSVSFNRQLQTNDGLLAHHVSDIDGVSYELALQKIRVHSGTMLQQLERGDVLDCGALGTLKTHASGGIVFDPSGLVNFSRSAFGLGPIAITEIDRQGVTIPVKPLFEAPSSPVPIWRYAAVALIALSLGGYGATQKYNQQVALFNLDSQQNVTKQVAKQIQEATFQINSALPIVELVIPKPHQPYHVVAGAFRVAQNAHNKVAQLMIKGFDAKIVGINSYGLHQVVYRSFTDRNEAINALRRIQKEESSDAWLLVK